MRGHGLRIFQRATSLEIGGNAGCPEDVAAELVLEARLGDMPSNHPTVVDAVHRRHRKRPIGAGGSPDIGRVDPGAIRHDRNLRRSGGSRRGTRRKPTAGTARAAAQGPINVAPRPACDLGGRSLDFPVRVALTLTTRGILGGRCDALTRNRSAFRFPTERGGFYSSASDLLPREIGPAERAGVGALSRIWRRTGPSVSDRCNLDNDGTEVFESLPFCRRLRLIGDDLHPAFVGSFRILIDDFQGHDATPATWPLSKSAG
jgi:hypothetical protein